MAACIPARKNTVAPRAVPPAAMAVMAGSIYLEANSRTTTRCSATATNREFKADRGRTAEGSNCTGHSGADMTCRFPSARWCSTTKARTIKPNHRRPWPARIDRPRCSTRWTSAINTLPSPGTRPRCEHEDGFPGEERYLRLELKLLRRLSVPPLGYPNAGKSTLISVISAARPENRQLPLYHAGAQSRTSSTRRRHRWARHRAGRTFVVADLSLVSIEGAHLGAGLCIRFLRHVERTRLLVI